VDTENDKIAWKEEGFCTIRVYKERAARREAESNNVHGFYYPGQFPSWGRDLYGDTSRVQFGG
jgi:hypothetical protein